ncbi:MAG TPA: hypothetical protein PK170_06565 [Anaerolineae bacterium]|nr:hypothetical protein [Anaerolineae bacterium]
MSATTPTRRPFGATLLAILAGLAALMAAVHLLQSLGILPYFIGEHTVRSFNLWNAFMWGLMLWVWVWVAQMLWRVDPQAWLFLAVITVFNLVLDFVLLLGSSTQWSDVSISFLINAVILIYIMLPGVRQAFGQK